jgi:hypothetical protein
VALVMAAAGFAQFSPAAALADVAEHFGELRDGETLAEQAGLPGTVLGAGLAAIRLSKRRQRAGRASRHGTIRMRRRAGRRSRREAHMFVVELSFSESQERLAERPAHRERLERLHDDGTVRMAGPFADDSGALLIFDVADETALDAILAEDPYFETPGVTVVRRRRWMPIVRG